MKINKLESTVAYLTNYIKTHMDSHNQYNTSTSTNQNGHIVSYSPYKSNRVYHSQNSEYETNRDCGLWHEVISNLKVKTSSYLLE